jgi:hypothetical protein
MFMSPVNKPDRFLNSRNFDDFQQKGGILDSAPYFSSMLSTPDHNFNGNEDISESISQSPTDSPPGGSPIIQQKKFPNPPSPIRGQLKLKTSPALSHIKNNTVSPSNQRSPESLIIDKSSTDKLKPVDFGRGSTKEKELDT